MKYRRAVPDRILVAETVLLVLITGSLVSVLLLVVAY
jgi:hypothetical protein